MSSKYYEWLARDVKPEEKRELTKEEKWKNWWYYYKRHVAVGAILLFCVADLIGGAIQAHRETPDYSVAYIGSTPLPEDTAAAFTDALEAIGEDLNKNGTVRVALNQYLIYAEDTADETSITKGDNLSYAYASQVRLTADFESCDSFFFLMEDPERFQNDYQILARLDGSIPQDDPGAALPLYLSWSESPFLSRLSLGEYQESNLGETITGSSQEILSGLYIGRRIFRGEKTCDHLSGCEDLWNYLIGDIA